MPGSQSTNIVGIRCKIINNRQPFMDSRQCWKNVPSAEHVSMCIETFLCGQQCFVSFISMRIISHIVSFNFSVLKLCNVNRALGIHAVIFQHQLSFKYFGF